LLFFSAGAHKRKKEPGGGRKGGGRTVPPLFSLHTRARKGERGKSPPSNGEEKGVLFPIPV